MNIYETTVIDFLKKSIKVLTLHHLVGIRFLDFCFVVITEDMKTQPESKLEACLILLYYYPERHNWSYTSELIVVTES